MMVQIELELVFIILAAAVVAPTVNAAPLPAEHTPNFHDLIREVAQTLVASSNFFRPATPVTAPETVNPAE